MMIQRLYAVHDLAVLKDLVVAHTGFSSLAISAMQEDKERAKNNLLYESIFYLVIILKNK